MDNTFEKRKKIIYDLICDDFYVPMKIKEIAMLLQIPRDQREELKEVLDALEAEGRISVSKRGKYTKGQARRLTGMQGDLDLSAGKGKKRMFLSRRKTEAGPFRGMRWSLSSPGIRTERIRTESGRKGRSSAFCLTGRSVSWACMKRAGTMDLSDRTTRGS